MTIEAPRLVAAMTVQSGREAEFEALVRDVIEPAVRQVKPHLVGQWQLLRPTEDPPSDATTPTYLLLFYGDVPWDEWDLADLLPAAYGEEEGNRRLEEFLELIGGEQTVYAVAPVERPDAGSVQP